MTDKCLLLFPSIHDVMATENILLVAKVYCDLIPVPRELSSECGMAVETLFAHLDVVRDALGNAFERCTGVFREDEAGRWQREISGSASVPQASHS